MEEKPTPQTSTTPVKKVSWATATAEGMREQLTKVLPQNITVDFYLQSLAATLAIQQDKYQNCDKMKLFYAIQRCAEAGLLPDGRKAAIIPYKDDAKLIIMVGGFVDKLDEAGYYVQPENVYANDGFSWIAGDNPSCNHKIDPFRDRGEYLGTYAIIRRKSDGAIVSRELISKDEMSKIRGSAKTKEVWDLWADEKCKAAVIKRAAKRLNLSPEVQKVIDVDNQDFDMDKAKNVTPSKMPTDLMDKLGLKKGSEIPEPTVKESLTVEPTKETTANDEDSPY